MQPEQGAATLESVLIGSLPALAEQLVGLLEQLQRYGSLQLPDLIALLAQLCQAALVGSRSRRLFLLELHDQFGVHIQPLAKHIATAELL